MSQLSPIEWTDVTWNPVRGCTRVSAGCQRCYAERTAARFIKPGQAYEGLAHHVGGEARWTGKLRTVPQALLKPLKWKTPRYIFVNSMSDLFHEDLPHDAIDGIFDVMESADWHIFQVLTKRSRIMRDYMGQRYAARPAPKNVWLGVSVEDQAAADTRVPALLETPAAVRFLSCEPLLGKVDITGWIWGGDQPCLGCPKDEDCECGWKTRRELGLPALDWVICGGESGPRKRPTDVTWHRDLMQQCSNGGISFFEKQIDKVQPIPADLMVREFPKVAA